MPTYVYQCAKCDDEFELWQSILDDPLKRHPGCGGKVTKVLQPVGIVLKGSGFYKTDSRNGGRKSNGKSDKGEKSDSSSGSEKSEKSEKKSDTSASKKSESKTSTPAAAST
jgi:putative FmdB family regulatory protein